MWVTWDIAPGISGDGNENKDDSEILRIIVLTTDNPTYEFRARGETNDACIMAPD